MKIAIISDTHKDYSSIDKIVSILKKCDLILFAGDNFSDSKYIHEKTGIDIIAVKGNCDFCDVEEEIIFDINEKKVFLCHGDKYNVKDSLDKISKKAKHIEADIVIFGHTHIPLEIKKEGILYLNPGSLSRPRKNDKKTFLLVDIDDDVKTNLVNIN